MADISRVAEGMGRYFRYQPQHQTVPEMAQMYRRLKMAFVVFTVDGEKGASRRITNEEIARLAHEHGDVAIPFASINPHRGAEGVREARRLIKDFGVRGLKFHPSVQDFYPNDRMAYPLYEAIAEAKLPALFHTGQTGVGAREVDRRVRQLPIKPEVRPLIMKQNAARLLRLTS